MTRAPADVRATREWLAYLAGATESIGSSLALEQAAVGLTAAVVPYLADHAAEYLSDYLLRETDLLPERGRLIGGVQLVATAGETGGPGVTVPPAGWLALAARDSAGPVVLPETDSRAGALFPLRVRGVILGFAVWTRLAGSFQETELLVGGQLAAQAALSMHDAYLYRREAVTVDVLQRDMLAVEPSDLPGIEIAHRMLGRSCGPREAGDRHHDLDLPQPLQRPHVLLRGGRAAAAWPARAGRGRRPAGLRPGRRRRRPRHVLPGPR